MNYYLFIPFAIILIFFCPIKLRFHFSFNILDFSGAIGVFLFGIKIDSQRIWIRGKKIVLKKDKQVTSKEIEFNDTEFVFIETFLSEIKDKIHLKELLFYYNFGLTDAYRTALTAGMINQAIFYVFSRLKSLKPTATLAFYDTIFYNKTTCNFAIKSTFSISLLDVVYSFFTSVILSKKKKANLSQKEKV